MSDLGKLIEIVTKVAAVYLPSNTTKVQLGCFITHLVEKGVMIQKHGRWVKNENVRYDEYFKLKYYDCSICGCEVSDLYGPYLYCPYCGAKMDGVTWG